MPSKIPRNLIYYHSKRKQWASLVAQLEKNRPAMRETWVRSLGWEDPLEKGTATHSNILTCRIPWTSPWGLKELDTTEKLSLTLSNSLHPHGLQHTRLPWLSPSPGVCQKKTKVWEIPERTQKMVKCTFPKTAADFTFALRVEWSEVKAACCCCC